MKNNPFRLPKKEGFQKRYKYLDYIPKPIHLDPMIYDLVGDKEFCQRDGRIPLLLITEYGVFPAIGKNNHKNYAQLHGLENRWVGYLGRIYLTNREKYTILLAETNRALLEQVWSGTQDLNLTLWPTLCFSDN
ncbi:MAG: hypothetical protein LW707_10810 [Sphingobacteriales bacterium]|jgi:hypothetical protein|nr:hypothetical protein [Sphingobacteriales bacterium]